MTADLTQYGEDKNHESQDVKLLAQAFKDLILGDLPIGGEIGVGRGVSTALNASMQHPDKGQITFTFADAGKVETNADSLDKWKELLNAN